MALGIKAQKSDWLTSVICLSLKLSWIREKGNAIGQAQVIPNHVNREDWFQPLPELITWKECPCRKEGFQKKVKKCQAGKDGRFLPQICSLLTDEETELRETISFAQEHTRGKLWSWGFKSSSV